MSDGRNTSIAKSLIGDADRLTASVIIVAPAGIVVVAWPANVSGLADPATIAESFPRTAIPAAPTVIGAVPNALLNTTRSRSPPNVVWTTCRSVWPLNCTGGGGPPRPLAGWAAGAAATAGEAPGAGDGTSGGAPEGTAAEGARHVSAVDQMPIQWFDPLCCPDTLKLPTISTTARTRAIWWDFMSETLRHTEGRVKHNPTLRPNHPARQTV